VPPYHQSEDLARFGDLAADAPEPWARFDAYYKAALAEGALSAREKALIALAVAHVVPCPYCTDAWTRGALEQGATREQIVEAVHVAAALQAGATLAQAIPTKQALDRLTM
jgi:alkylhydroperoxidase/carboxymuconolactone decarboxylase family protein